MQIYLNGGLCCRVQQSDRLGFTNDNQSSVLAYPAINLRANFTLLPQIGDVLSFNVIQLPYVFAFAAAYDNGELTCPLEIDVSRSTSRLPAEMNGRWQNNTETDRRVFTRILNVGLICHY
jgi:hypothetical protein